MKVILVFLAGCGLAPSTPIDIALVTSALSPSQVQSYQLWVLDGVDRTSAHAPLSCDEFLSRTLTPGGDNVVQVIGPINGGTLGATLDVDNIPGSTTPRLFYIDLFDQPALLGNRIGAGCAEQVLKSYSTVNITLTVSTPPPEAR